MEKRNRDDTSPSVFSEQERAEFLTDMKDSLNAFLWTRLPGNTTLIEAEELCCKLFEEVAHWYDARR